MAGKESEHRSVDEQSGSRRVILTSRPEPNPGRDGRTPARRSATLDRGMPRRRTPQHLATLPRVGAVAPRCAHPHEPPHTASHLRRCQNLRRLCRNPASRMMDPVLCRALLPRRVHSDNPRTQIRSPTCPNPTRANRAANWKWRYDSLRQHRKPPTSQTSPLSSASIGLFGWATTPSICRFGSYRTCGHSPVSIS